MWKRRSSAIVAKTPLHCKNKTEEIAIPRCSAFLWDELVKTMMLADWTLHKYDPIAQWGMYLA